MSNINRFLAQKNKESPFPFDDIFWENFVANPLYFYRWYTLTMDFFHLDSSNWTQCNTHDLSYRIIYCVRKSFSEVKLHDGSVLRYMLEPFFSLLKRKWAKNSLTYTWCVYFVVFFSFLWWKTKQKVRTNKHELVEKRVKYDITSTHKQRRADKKKMLIISNHILCAPYVFAYACSSVHA